jgi:hypothetical protein
MIPSKSLYVMAAASLFIFSGCANREGVAPSQNASLQSVSPSSTAANEGGAMQRSLDAWLKEEWTPLTDTPPSQNGQTPSSGATATTSVEAKAPEAKDEEPFTLQKYADKWKVYHENKAKRDEGKPKEASHVEMMSTLPVVGK